MVTHPRILVCVKAKVLIVDDEPEFLDLLEFNLARQWFEVITARDGMHGLHRARVDLPDIILVDLMLPDIDGISVCEILRAQPSTRDIPLMMMSASEWQVAGNRWKGAQVTRYFNKPVDMGTLGASLLAAFEQRRLALRSLLAS
jgi:DNA-binding response OmpR family regulator